MAGLVPDVIRYRTSKGDGTTFGSLSVASQLTDIRAWLGTSTLAGRMGFLSDEVFEAWLGRAAQYLQEADNFDAALGVLDVVGLEAWLRAYWEFSTH
jgi:hypothetical protein